MLIVLIFNGCSENNKAEYSKVIDSKSEPLIESFFQSLQKGDFQNSLKTLLATNESIDLKDSSTIKLLSSFEDMNAYSGKLVSKRLIRKRNLQDDVCIYSYIVKYEKKFYRYVFVFYNNDINIKLFKFSFDDSIGIELEESIKLYGF